MLPTIIIIGVIVLILLWVFGAYNSLVKLRIGCDEGFATMDVYMKKRFDLIPNLVSTVKGYAKHEAETLEHVVAQRNSGATRTVEQKIADENQISGALRQIFALAESYPDLKANSNFQDLMRSLGKVEEDIANARKYHNAVVKKYNMATMVVPKNIIAGMFHFEQRPMFEVDDAAERKNVNVSFDS